MYGACRLAASAAACSLHGAGPWPAQAPGPSLTEPHRAHHTRHAVIPDTPAPAPVYVQYSLSPKANRPKAQCPRAAPLAAAGTTDLRVLDS